MAFCEIHSKFIHFITFYHFNLILFYHKIEMKVRVISRNPDEYMRETKHDIHRLKRNYDATLHPMEGARKLFSCV